MNPGHYDTCQAPILHHFGQADTPRRLVLYDDASTRPLLSLAITTWRRRIIPLESGRTRFSSRFSSLIVSLTTGEDAFPCSQGVGNWPYASPNIKIQVIKDFTLCRSSPGKYRSRPNVSHIISTTVVLALTRWSPSVSLLLTEPTTRRGMAPPHWRAS